MCMIKLGQSVQTHTPPCEYVLLGLIGHYRKWEFGVLPQRARQMSSCAPTIFYLLAPMYCFGATAAGFFNAGFIKSKLAGTVAIAAHCSWLSWVIAIWEYSAGDVVKMLRWFCHIQHENLMCLSECYRHKCSQYAVVDNLLLTLKHLGSCTVCPNEV